MDMQSTGKATNARKQSDFSLAVVAQIRAEMGAERLSTRALAHQAGIPERTLARLINGDRTIDVAQLDMICRALKVPMAVLLERAHKRRLEDDAGRTVQASGE